MDSPPSSQLSEYSSEDFNEEVKARPPSLSPEREPVARPAKRQRVTRESPDTTTTTEPGAKSWEWLRQHDPLSDDTDGSVPPSPNHPGEEEHHDRQVSICKWDGCTVGDLGNMDNLVEHLHEDHIGVRQKKYSCEWIDCQRKGTPHASGYALRAHMRSHTREKPFYCTLPECDRSFTRSDALAKHMRTVHETEALRPSDPVPKHHSSNPTKPQRLKLIINKNGVADHKAVPESPAVPNSTGDAALDYANNNIAYVADPTSPTGPPQIQFPPDIHFTDSELRLPANELYRLLRRQHRWAHEEASSLKAKIDELEKLRFEEWMKKELLLENGFEADLFRMMRKKQEMGVDVDGLWPVLDEDLGPARKLEYTGGLPWWRDSKWLEPGNPAAVSSNGQQNDVDMRRDEDKSYERS